MVPTRLLTVAVGMVTIVAAMQGVSAAATDATPVMRIATLAVGDWPMNETSGQTMVDVSGNGLDGYIGSSVLINVPTDDGTGYRFQGPLNVQNRERLVLVDDTPMLDPGTETYSVSVRFRTFGSRPNILQKGQSEDTGGYWKLVIHTGWPRCHYRDENYNTKAIGFVRSPDPNAKVNDGDWHTLALSTQPRLGVRLPRRGDAHRHEQVHPRSHRSDRQQVAVVHRRQDAVRSAPGIHDVRLLQRRHRLGADRQTLSRSPDDRWRRADVTLRVRRGTGSASQTSCRLVCCSCVNDAC